MGLRLSRLTLAALCIWLGLLFYISTILVRVQQENAQLTAVAEQMGGRVAADYRGDGVEETIQKIKQASRDIDALRRDNEELRRLLSLKHISPPPINPQILTDASFKQELAHMSKQHESLRRTIENGAMELFYYFSGQLRKTQGSLDKSSEAWKALERTQVDGGTQFRYLFAQLDKLSEVDGAAQWRNSRLNNLTNLVQSRLDKLQNPGDCKSARRLVCNLNKGCGFGCQIHHAAYCFLVAYSTQRTLILETNGWRYSHKGWNSVFLPTSRTCESTSLPSVAWKGAEENKEDLVVSLPIVDSLRPRPPTLPLSFPREFAQQLLHLHGNPPVWWMAQFVWYLMRYSDDLKKELAETKTVMNFEGPIVGLHVRRTDKLGSEAQFHGIEEYMQWANNWFEAQSFKEGKLIQKKIFLATDDPNLIAETKKKYPDFVVLGSQNIANSAQLNSRYTDSSLRGVLVDIHFLSRTDYLVCTFSSQVCRVAYELMQVFRGDYADRYHSLDDIYYYGGQHGHEQLAQLPHQPLSSSELAIRPGDVIGVAGNHWDGWSKGRNSRTQEVGLYPSYKAREKWRIVKYPTYRDRG